MFSNIDTISIIYIIMCVLILLIILIIYIHKINKSNNERIILETERLNREHSFNREELYIQLHNDRINREFNYHNLNKKLKNDIKNLVKIKKDNPNITLNEARLQLLDNDTNYINQLVNSSEINELYNNNIV